MADSLRFMALLTLGFLVYLLERVPPPSPDPVAMVVAQIETGHPSLVRP